jgi:hypothetical protein
MVVRNWTPLIHATALAILAALLASIALLWVWNTVGHDLLGAPKAQFKHAAAFLVGLIAVGAAFGRRRH